MSTPRWARAALEREREREGGDLSSASPSLTPPLAWKATRQNRHYFCAQLCFTDLLDKNDTELQAYQLCCSNFSQADCFDCLFSGLFLKIKC